MADEANHVIKVVPFTIRKAVLNTSTLKYSDLVLFDLISFIGKNKFKRAL